jgi:vancomycin permeability regulator SanA
MSKRLNAEEGGHKRARKGLLARAASIVLLLCILCATGVVYLNRIVVGAYDDRILTETEALALEDVDCILVLGAGVYANKYPSAMLEDRLTKGIGLYELGVSDRLLMSGDNSEVHYNEVKVMKDYAIKSGVPSAHVFQDHAGFSTYESMYRARDVFAAKKIVIVTQEYHLYRALFIAQALGLDAYGVAAEPIPYAGQMMRECRELLARAKDFFSCVFKPLPTFLGDVIPVSGNGDATD